MKIQRKSGSSLLFLTELMIAILFFAIAGAVCIQIIVRSHNFSKKAQNLNTAVAQCTSIAELTSSADSFAEVSDLFSSVYPQAQATDSGADSISYSINYDSNGNVLDPESAQTAAIHTIEWSLNDHMLICHQEFCITAHAEPLYVLDTSHYLQRRAGS